MGKARKIILWVLLAFFVYAIFTYPDRAADIVANIWGSSSTGSTRSSSSSTRCSTADAIWLTGSPWRSEDARGRSLGA